MVYKTLAIINLGYYRQLIIKANKKCVVNNLECINNNTIYIYWQDPPRHLTLKHRDDPVGPTLENVLLKIWYNIL